MTFGEWLSHAMQAAGFPTNTALADASGVSEGSISRWRNGAEPPRVPALRKLSNALGVPMRELLVRAELVTWEEQEYDAPLPNIDATEDFEEKLADLEMSDEAREIIRQEFLRMQALSRVGSRPVHRRRTDGNHTRKSA